MIFKENMDEFEHKIWIAVFSYRFVKSENVVYSAETADKAVYQYRDLQLKETNKLMKGK